MPALLCILDFAHIELPNTVDRPAIVNNSGCLSLCFRKNDVDEVFAGWYYFDGFEVVQRHSAWPRVTERIFASRPHGGGDALWLDVGCGRHCSLS